LTTIDCVVAPVDQILLVAEDEVNVTVPPGHKVTGPAGEIVGVDKDPEMVTVIELDTKAGQPPTLLVAVYVPEVVTVISCVVAPPGDQVIFVPILECRITEPPVQKVVGPVATITGV